MPKYIRNQTITTCKKALKSIESFYKDNCVNWTGTTSNTKELYTEIIANELLKNLSVFNNIKAISRTNPYEVKSHFPISINPDSKRDEENFAKRITLLEFESLGKILDYQIPIKDKQTDDAGKIDLISFNQATNK